MISSHRKAVQQIAKGIMNIEIGTKVRVKGRGNTIFTLADKSSPVRHGEWVVRRASGALFGVKADSVKPVKTK